MDISTFLLIIIVLVAASLIAVCIYVVLFLKEARETLKNTNILLNHFSSLVSFVDEKIARPTTSLLSAFNLGRDIIKIIEKLKKRKDN